MREKDVLSVLKYLVALGTLALPDGTPGAYARDAKSGLYTYIGKIRFPRKKI
jgi:hypothetical protein